MRRQRSSVVPFLRRAQRIWTRFNPERPFPEAELRELAAFGYGPGPVDRAMAACGKAGDLSVESVTKHLTWRAA